MSSPFSKFLKKNSASFANTSVPNPSSLPDLIASKIAALSCNSPRAVLIKIAPSFIFEMNSAFTILSFFPGKYGTCKLTISHRSNKSSISTNLTTCFASSLWNTSNP